MSSDPRVLGRAGREPRSTRRRPRPHVELQRPPRGAASGRLAFALRGKRLAIRCLPRVPVAIPDLEQWLDRQLDEFRQRDGQATLRPSRLTSARPNRDIAISWLIELEVPRDKPVPAWDHVASMLRDLRLLGLQPTLLAGGGLVSTTADLFKFLGWTLAGCQRGSESADLQVIRVSEGTRTPDRLDQQPGPAGLCGDPIPLGSGVQII